VRGTVSGWLECSPLKLKCPGSRQLDYKIFQTLSLIQHGMDSWLSSELQIAIALCVFLCKISESLWEVGHWGYLDTAQAVI